MVNKKYLLLAGLCTMMAQPLFAQESQPQNNPQGGAQWSARDMTYRGQSYDVLDSSYIPKSRMAQHRKFLNHQYVFPAKPRNMWEIGVAGGLYNVAGSVPTLMPWQKGGFGLSAHIRKSWGYIFSTRLDYDYGIAKGLQWQGAENYRYNTAWNQNYNFAGSAAAIAPGGKAQPVFYNYRMESSQLNLDLMLNTNNIKFHHARTGVSFFGYVGLGGLAYNTRVNTLDANNQPYNFAAIVGNTPETYANRNTIRKALQSAMDNSYETAAETNSTTRKPQIFGNKTFDFAPSVGAGAQVRLSKRINLQIEDRFTIPVNESLLDGQRWSEQVSGSPVMTKNNEFLNYASIGINFNIGNKHKMVEPLYWLNPLDFAYNELNYPRHMILPEPILPDSDGDGITDQFDKCPGTPAGVAVDSHGCPLDTDGDGVPDFRDKQLITPTECQPVDADGVGKCPCPDGCGNAVGAACGNIGAGSIIFTSNSAHIGAGMQAQMATLAAQMQANPTCKVVITGAGNGSKLQQQRSWDRVNAVIEYMSEKNGISRDRFIFQYGQAGDANTVMYRSAMSGEEGPANVAPPFPNLRK